MMGSIPYKDVRMVTSLSLTTLIFLFCFAAIVIWYAGIALSESTDAIDERFGLAEALGGLILLALVTNLPEIAIVFSAAYTHQMGIVIGNILGGIAIQTVVLVLLDGIGMGKGMALTYRASSPQLVLEGVLVVSVLLIAIMGTQLPQSLVYSRLAPPDILIVITWFVGLWLANKARNGLTWKQKVVFHPKRKVVKKHTPKTFWVFFSFRIGNADCRCVIRAHRQRDSRTPGLEWYFIWFNHFGGCNRITRSIQRSCRD